MASKGTVIIAIETEHKTHTDLAAQFTNAPSDQSHQGIQLLINLLHALLGGTEEGKVLVSTPTTGAGGATAFTAASLTTLRTYKRGV